MPRRLSHNGQPAASLLALLIFVLTGCTPPRTVHPLAELNHAGPLERGAVVEMDVIDLEAIEKRVLVRVNEERASRRLAPLLRNASLDDLARAHSADMARWAFFDHTNPRGEDPTRRGEAAGVECGRPAGDNRIAVGLGENIFSTYLFSSFNVHTVGGVASRTYAWKSADGLADEAVEGWMSSRGHRLNLLSRQYLTIGIGAARDNQGQLFLTQNFC